MMVAELSKTEICENLKRLIRREQNAELECREYLQLARELLVRDTVVDYEYVETERRGNVGDSDYVISGRVTNEVGIVSVRAYVWELKAPQCYLFQKDTENRLIPTPDLFKAENQLFHYYDQLKGDDDFRHQFGVSHPDNVHFGGIIIGSRQRCVRGEYAEEKKARLFDKAMRIRDTYVYKPLGIRLMYWNRILDYLVEGSPTPGDSRSIERAISAKSLQLENITYGSP